MVFLKTKLMMGDIAEESEKISGKKGRGRNRRDAMLAVRKGRAVRAREMYIPMKILTYHPTACGERHTLPGSLGSRKGSRYESYHPSLLFYKAHVKRLGMVWDQMKGPRLEVTASYSTLPTFHKKTMHPQKCLLPSPCLRSNLGFSHPPCHASITTTRRAWIRQSRRNVSVRSTGLKVSIIIPSPRPQHQERFMVLLHVGHA